MSTREAMTALQLSRTLYLARRVGLSMLPQPLRV